MFNTKTLTKALAGSLVLASLALAGCGSNAVNATDTYLEDPGYTDPSGGYTDPSTGYNNGGTTTPATPGYGTLPATTAAPLTASITKKKNGSLLGMGKYVVTVEVSNPAQVQQTGTLTVTFTNGKSKKTVATETKSISLAAGATETLTIENKKWSTDDVTIDITTDTPVTPVGTGTGTGTGYGY